jgi:hypothetical protein
MEIFAVVLDDGLLDYEARKLVPESDGISVGPENPGRLALLQGVERPAGYRLQQPELGAPRHDRDRVEKRPRGRTEAARAREDRVADRRGYVAGSTRERLRDEEGVACRLRVQVGRVDPKRGGELLDRTGRERMEADADDACSRRQVAEGPAERMRPLQLVGSVGNENESPEMLDPPSEQAEDVERRVVGPMDVLDDHDGLTAGA